MSVPVTDDLLTPDLNRRFHNGGLEHGLLRFHVPILPGTRLEMGAEDPADRAILPSSLALPI